VEEFHKAWSGLPFTSAFWWGLIPVMFAVIGARCVSKCGGTTQKGFPCTKSGGKRVGFFGRCQYHPGQRSVNSKKALLWWTASGICGLLWWLVLSNHQLFVLTTR
jgi:hypothetical protein